jgi:acyl carrier protein
MTTTSSSAMDGVIDFLRQRNPAVNAVDWSQDLIDMRILDSLAFVEFIFLLEELSGTQIDPQMIDVENFRTLERIDKAFFGGEGK